MKYLKKFENIKYKVGDYILIDRDEIDSELATRRYKRTIPSNNDVAKIFLIDDDEYSHGILFNDNIEYFIKLSEIKRLATPEEIEHYELKDNTKKYNL